MEQCYICEDDTTPSDSIKCEGVCDKSMHAKCVGMTKAALKAYNDMDSMYYICDKCVSNSMMAINKKLDSVMSIFHIYDERVTRYEKDMKELLTNVCDLKSMLGNNNLKLLVNNNDTMIETINPTVVRDHEKQLSKVNKKEQKTKTDTVVLIKPKNNQNCHKT